MLVFGCISVTLCDIAGETLVRFSMEEAVTSESIEEFTRAEALLHGSLPEVSRYYRNIMANHMFYEQFPYVQEGTDFGNAYLAFCAAYILVRFLCANSADASCVRDRFADRAAAAMRYIEHTDFYKNAPYVMRRLRRITDAPQNPA